MLLPLHLNGLNLDSGTAVAVVSGTFQGATEAQIVSGGRTVVITLTNDTWVAAGATFNAQRQNIINGLDSAQSETTGWNNEVRDNEVVTAVVRTSDTVVTITLSASASYDITADETITVTVPATALTGAVELTGTPTATIEAAEEPARKGGRAKRKYVVEVDGELFQVANLAAVQSFLENVRQTAQEAAERDVLTEVVPKPPLIRVRTLRGAPTTSKTLQKEIRRTQKAVTTAYVRQAERIRKDNEVNAEIALLFQKKIEQEEEENLLILLSL